MSATTTQRKKTVLITGASSGIGHSLAIEFAKRGYHVFACARRLAPMQDLADTYGVDIFEMDVGSTKSIAVGKEFVLSKLAELQPKLAASNSLKLDVLYNNAGIAMNGPAIDVTDEELFNIYNVNVLGPAKIVREFSDLVINAKGLIAFTGSIAAVMPFAFGSYYAATKAAIHQYANILSIEMKPFGVSVINICTGQVSTAIAQGYSLSKTSRYYSEAMVVGMDAQQEGMKDGSDSNAYAASCVDCIEKHRVSSNVLHYYKGKMASVATFMVSILPRSWAIAGVLSNFKMNDGLKLVKEKADKDFQKD